MEVIKYYTDCENDFLAIRNDVEHLQKTGASNPNVKSDADALIVRLDNLALNLSKMMAYAYGAGVSDNSFTDIRKSAEKTADKINLKSGRGSSPFAVNMNNLVVAYKQEGHAQSRVMDTTPSIDKDLYLRLDDRGLSFSFEGSLPITVSNEADIRNLLKKSPKDELLQVVNDLMVTIKKVVQTKGLVRTVVADFVAFIAIIRKEKGGVSYGYIPSGDDTELITISESEFNKFGKTRVSLELAMISALDYYTVLNNTVKGSEFETPTRVSVVETENLKMEGDMAGGAKAASTPEPAVDEETPVEEEAVSTDEPVTDPPVDEAATGDGATTTDPLA